MEARAKTFAFFADAGICKLQWLLLAFSLESGYPEVNMILQQRQRNSSGLST